MKTHDAESLEPLLLVYRTKAIVQYSTNDLAAKFTQISAPETPSFKEVAAIMEQTWSKWAAEAEHQRQLKEQEREERLAKVREIKRREEEERQQKMEAA